MLEVTSLEKQSRLRNQLVNLESQRVLMARIEGSIEADDEYTHVNCQGYGRIRKYSSFKLHFNRQVSVRQPIISNALDSGKYDTQVFQLAGCDFRCWYCFVDDELLRGDESRARWFSAGELLDLALTEAVAPRVIDLSGGQPALVPELTLWVMEEVERRGLRGELAVWSDDNLSCDFIWKNLESTQRKYIAEFPGHVRTVCIKGFDAKSFSANTGAPEFFFERQLEILQRLVDDGFTLEVYLTMLDVLRPPGEAAAAMDALLARLTSINSHLPHRVIPLKVSPFGNLFRRANARRLKTLGLQVERFQLWVDRIAAHLPSTSSLGLDVENSSSPTT